jgi:hypothetical protein
MKKFLLPILGVVLVIGMATIVWASVIGTKHELGTEPCAMCHTPHHASSAGPLWNRTQEDVGNYVLYESLSFDMGVSKTQPRVPSKLCLTCHNGVLSGLVNYPGPCSVTDSAYDLEISGCADLGTDLMNDHPISFDYVDTLDQDKNGFTPPVPLGVRGRQAIAGSISETLYPLYGEGGTNNWFECSTCHSVHDTEVYPGKGDYQVFFLRNDNTGSTMCLDCHKNR